MYHRKSNEVYDCTPSLSIKASLVVASFTGLLIVSTSHATSIVGTWQCHMSVNNAPVGSGELTFGSDLQGSMTGQPFNYQLLKGNVLRLVNGTTYSDYHYRLGESSLKLTYADGSVFDCQRATGNEHSGKQKSSPAQRGGGSNWQLTGAYCSWSGSSSYSSSSNYSSYSTTRRLNFDGQGHWNSGSESSFSGSSGMAYGGSSSDSGSYQIVGQQIQYQTASGERGVAQINMQQKDGRITEIMVNGTLYAPALCE